MKNLKTALTLLKQNTYTQIAIAIAWAVTFFQINQYLINNATDYNGWAFWTGLVGLGVWVVIALIMMWYAWVVNPRRDRKERNTEES